MYQITITKVSKIKNPNGDLLNPGYTYDKELFSTDVNSDQAIELLSHAYQLEKEQNARGEKECESARGNI